MIRWLLLPALALAAGAILAIGLREDPGYVLMQIAGYTLESSLAGLVLLLGVALALLSLVLKILNRGVQLPSEFGGYLRERRLEKARLQLKAGLNQLAAGQYERAEVELLRRVSDLEKPAINYLYAAQAAHELGEGRRRDQYLEQARLAGPEQQAAVLLKQAEYWASENRHDEALMALDRLANVLPKHKPALQLRLSSLAAQKHWSALQAALADAKGRVFSEELLKYSRLAYVGLIQQARSDLEALRATWQGVPKNLKSDACIAAEYAQHLHAAGADAEALRVITPVLKMAWQPDLVLLYGHLDGGDVVRQLAKVEEWIKQHGDKPELLLVAGRLCTRNRLWGRARSYLEACLSMQPSAEVRLELGRLLLQQGEDESAALKMFQAGLEATVEGEALPVNDEPAQPQPLAAPVATKE